MPAAAKQKHKGSRHEVRDGHRKLTLIPKPNTEPSLDAIPELFIRAAVPGTSHEVQLLVDVGERERQLAQGEPVSALLIVPDFGLLDPSAGDDRITITSDSIEGVLHAMRRCVEEARRCGMFPPLD